MSVVLLSQREQHFIMLLRNLPLCLREQTIDTMESLYGACLPPGERERFFNGGPPMRMRALKGSPVKGKLTNDRLRRLSG